MSGPTGLDRPTSAGMYDYYLGGTANTPADRAAAEQIRQVLPELVDVAWANRGFLQRAVTRLAADWGIRQFIDIGAGLPTRRNTHEVVAALVPGSHVVYVDHDPRVVERGRELLSGVPGAAVIEADIRRPDAILDHPQTRELIDFTAPVALLMVAVTHFVPDADDPWGLVARYVDAVPSGSYLVLSAGTADYQAEDIASRVRQVYASTPTPIIDRTRPQVERYFDSLEIVPPYEGAGPVVTFTGLWGAEDVAAADSDGSRWFYAAVARKP